MIGRDEAGRPTATAPGFGRLRTVVVRITRQAKQFGLLDDSAPVQVGPQGIRPTESVIIVSLKQIILHQIVQSRANSQWPVFIA
jgi:hypothetical protein